MWVRIYLDEKERGPACLYHPVLALAQKQAVHARMVPQSGCQDETAHTQQDRRGENRGLVRTCARVSQSSSLVTNKKESRTSWRMPILSRDRCKLAESISEQTQTGMEAL